MAIAEKGKEAARQHQQGSQLRHGSQQQSAASCVNDLPWGHAGVAFAGLYHGNGKCSQPDGGGLSCFRFHAAEQISILSANPEQHGQRKPVEKRYRHAQEHILCITIQGKLIL